MSSMYHSVSLVVCTHGVLNSVLLWWSGCFVWNLTQCTEDMQRHMDWLLLHHTSLYVLLAILAYRTTPGNKILEERLGMVMNLVLVATLVSSMYLSSHVNTMILRVQNMIHIALLATLYVKSATLPLQPQPTPTHLLRNTSFDVRRKVPVVTVALAFQVVMSLCMSYDNNSREVVTSSSVLVDVIQQTSRMYQCLVTVAVLGSSLVWASPAQQQLLLAGYVLTLLVQQWLLQEPMQLLGNFLAILIGVLGAMQPLPK